MSTQSPQEVVEHNRLERQSRVPRIKVPHVLADLQAIAREVSRLQAIEAAARLEHGGRFHHPECPICAALKDPR